jgi:ABC-2 type transport system ATP-binding protein
MIVTQGLTKRFGSLVAVDSLDIHVKEGDIYGFLGPNGAGKTTTIRMLATLLAPTSGTALIMGRDVIEDPNGARNLIGFMPERPAFYEEMRARDVLRFYGSFYRMPKDELDARITHLSGLVGLDRFIDARSRATPTACASASPSRWRCSTGRRSSSSTSPARGWTPRA